MNLATFIAKITLKKNTERFTPAWAWSCRLFSSLLGPSTKWPECITCFIYSIPRLIEVSLLNITSTIYGFSWLFQQRNPSRPLSGSFLCLAVRCCHSSGMSTLAQVINKSLARSFTFPEESKNCTPNRQRPLHTPTVLHQNTLRKHCLNSVPLIIISNDSLWCHVKTICAAGKQESLVNPGAESISPLPFVHGVS